MNNTLPTEENFRYSVAHCISFKKTKEKFGGLSNMASGYPVVVNGVVIRTSEALYQACRFPSLPEVQDLILRQASPMAAKMKGKPHPSREDFNVHRIAIMDWALRVKLACNFESFGALLRSTSEENDFPIVEVSHKDRFWGAVPSSDGTTYEGCNILGRLLNRLRTRLIEGDESLVTVDPLLIPSFTLYNQPIQKVGCSPWATIPPSTSTGSSGPVTSPSFTPSSTRSPPPSPRS